MSGVEAWLSKPATTPDVAAPVPVRVRRAVQSQSGVVAPDSVDQLRVREVRPTATVWWVGVHGGAGESTLATLTGQAAGHAWPHPIDGSKARVVLVARTHASGLTRLSDAVRHWASGGLPFIDLDAVVLNADQPGRLPKRLHDHALHATGGAPDVWHIPYMSAWRLGVPAAVHHCRELRVLIDHLTQGENS
ncbi:MAG: DUF6668 family protein [Demequina sp.]|uniref:DUF6668 family protein n=1 Tax=Demequina sp. TaxID=2050685 RepID=UPI003A897C50